MPAPPLTHHEILELAAPFTRIGRHVDLAASHRIARRIAFKPIEHSSPPPLLSGLRETLELHSYGTGTFVLTRVLTLASGLRARAVAMGPMPADLLAQMAAVTPQRQFQSGDGHVVARSYELGSRGGSWILTEGEAQVEGLRLNMTLMAVRGTAAEIRLVPVRPDTLELPEDLLAVLGWDWARLIRDKDGWRTKLRLRGHLDKRSATAEIALERAAAHLARCFAEPPGQFHDRWIGARWGVFLRRGIPMLTLLALVAAMFGLRHIAAAGGSQLWMLLFQVPTALIALSLSLQELAQYEIPPLPQRSSAPSWNQGT